MNTALRNTIFSIYRMFIVCTNHAKCTFTPAVNCGEISPLVSPSRHMTRRANSRASENPFCAFRELS